MRRSEIVLVMVIDMARQKFPDAYGSVGFTLVLISCCGMAFSNDIQMWLNTKLESRRRKSDSSEEEI